MEAASIRSGAHAAGHVHEEEHHHGPPEANRSSRVEPQLLGMLLFIISEIMVFGAFFTAYFFIRVVNGDEWPAAGTELPKLIAGVNTAILLSSSFTMHWALECAKSGNRFGLKAGIVTTLGLGATFLYVTHAQIEAMTMATHVGVLDGGRLEQVGTPREVYEDPVSLAVAVGGAAPETQPSRRRRRGPGRHASRSPTRPSLWWATSGRGSMSASPAGAPPGLAAKRRRRAVDSPAQGGAGLPDRLPGAAVRGSDTRRRRREGTRAWRGCRFDRDGGTRCDR